MDVHLHTGANLRRYLLGLEGVSLRNKLLALLTWHTGPEVRSTQDRMEPPPQPNPGAVAALPHRTQAELLDALAERAPLVEVGAGLGYWAAALRARGVPVLALDSHPPGGVA